MARPPTPNGPTSPPGRPGRPRHPLEKRIQIRLSHREHRHWLRLARDDRRDLSDWIRLVVESAIKAGRTGGAAR